jgi:hypothetical protein
MRQTEKQGRDKQDIQRLKQKLQKDPKRKQVASSSPPLSLPSLYPDLTRAGPE